MLVAAVGLTCSGSSGERSVCGHEPGPRGGLRRLVVLGREQRVSPTSPGEIRARSACRSTRDNSRVTAEDASPDQPCPPTLVMSCRARTRHTGTVASERTASSRSGKVEALSSNRAARIAQSDQSRVSTAAFRAQVEDVEGGDRQMQQCPRCSPRWWPLEWPPWRLRLGCCSS